MALPTPDDEPEPEDHQKDDEDAEEDEYDLTHLINQATHRVEPVDICHVLLPPPTAKKDKHRTKHNDLQVTLHETIYNVSAYKSPLPWFIKVQMEGLLDTMFDNHKLTDLKIVTAGGVCPSYQGEVVVIIHQYAYNPGHLSICRSKWNSLGT